MAGRKFSSGLVRRTCGGVTLVETAVAIALLAVAVLGASGYRYYAALDSRKAGMHRTAAAIALLLCENWRGLGYTQNPNYFDPVAHLAPQLAISVSTVGPTGFTNKLGSYQIVVERVYYWGTLSWKDDVATPGLRALNVVVAWKQAGSATEITTFDSSAKLFKLTTYVSD